MAELTVKSGERSSLTLTWSAARWLFAVLVMLAAAVAGVFLLPPQLFLYARNALEVPALIVGVSFFLAQAIKEEATKAVGIGLASLRRNRFSWFTLTVATAGVMGLIERLLLAMNWAPDPERSPTALMLFLMDARSVAGHVALSLICVMVARVLGGNLRGWALGVLTAGILHGLVNFLPRQVPIEIRNALPLLTTAISAALFIAIIVFAFTMRRKLDWRTMHASG